MVKERKFVNPISSYKLIKIISKENERKVREEVEMLKLGNSKEERRHLKIKKYSITYFDSSGCKASHWALSTDCV